LGSLAPANQHHRGTASAHDARQAMSSVPGDCLIGDLIFFSQMAMAS